MFSFFAFVFPSHYFYTQEFQACHYCDAKDFVPLKMDLMDG